MTRPDDDLSMSSAWQRERRDPVAELDDMVAMAMARQALRPLVPAQAPAPTAALAAMLRDGLPPAVPQRRLARLVGRLTGLGIAGKLLLAAGVAAAGVGTTATAVVLSHGHPSHANDLDSPRNHPVPGPTTVPAADPKAHDAADDVDRPGDHRSTVVSRLDDRSEAEASDDSRSRSGGDDTRGSDDHGGSAADRSGSGDGSGDGSADRSGDGSGDRSGDDRSGSTSDSTSGSGSHDDAPTDGSSGDSSSGDSSSGDSSGSGSGDSSSSGSGDQTSISSGASSGSDDSTSGSNDH